MVSKRRYARRYRRRFRGRGSSFSKFNLYRKKSAASQAFQIYRLNRKFSNYAKKNKPKVRTAVHDIQFNCSGASMAAFGSPTQRIINNVLPDAKLYRLLDAKLTFNIYPASRDTIFEVDFEPSVFARVIVFQYKQAHSNIDTQPWELWDVTQEAFTSQNAVTKKQAVMYCLTGPLKDGTSSKFRILRDFHMNYNPWKERGTKMCRLKYLMNLQPAPDKTYAKGTLVYVCVWWTNLFDSANTDTKKMTFRVISKMAFTASVNQ